MEKDEGKSWCGFKLDVDTLWLLLILDNFEFDLDDDGDEVVCGALLLLSNSIRILSCNLPRLSV